MLRQDDAVEAQREQERLEHQANLAVQTLERLVAGAEERLADWTAQPSAPVPDSEHGGLLVAFTPTTVEPSPSSRLLFYPSLPVRPEPPARLFAAGEIAEFQQRDQRRAAAMYRGLARSADPAVRAAALMRLGRTLRASARQAESLSAYADMAALGDVPVVGLPADLVARAAEIQVLAEIDRGDEARAEARTLSEDLANGRWMLTAGQYEHYADAAAGASGDDPARNREDVAMARAAADVRAAWTDSLPPGGRRAIRVGNVPLLAVWRSAPDRLGVWIVPPHRLLEGFPADPQVAIALSDAEGVAVAGTLHQGAGRNAIRTPSDTRLPWTVRARTASIGVPQSGLASGLTRGRLVVLGLGLMLVFLVAGVYVIGRAVRQEMDLARLQSDFVSAVSHEFRTPLAAMRQLSELLAAGRVPHEERRQEYYESLAHESRRLQRLVENLLNFSRLQADGRPYRLEPLDPRALVEQVVAEFRSELARFDCEIDVRGADAPVRMLADRDGVALALHSLLDNAVKYGGAGHRVSVSWTSEDGRVALRVRDQGPGIVAEEQTRIFDRFVRGTAAAAANVRGTGIGLAMVKQVVTGHGGEVTVDSAPGAGSVFTMWLPAEPTAQSLEPRAWSPEPRAQSLEPGAQSPDMPRILIVEDEAVIAGALRDDLTLEGYDVAVVADGAAASKRATSERFDLIVLDVMLPGRDVRKAGLQTPILMLTARTQELEKVAAFELGADDYVTKPFGTKELRSRIKALLRRSGAPPDEAPAPTFHFGDVEVDLARGEVRRGGQPVDVTLTEFKLLMAFVKNRGRVLSRQQLLDAAWGPGIVLSDRAVDNHIVGLRRKIEPTPAEPRHLVSVRGLGYRLDA